MGMTDLDRALVDIRNIRRQVAQSTEFRGYGPVTLSFTAAVAVLAGVAQSLWLPDPASRPLVYVMLWLSVAVLCAALIATEMLARARRLHADLAGAMVSAAVYQFLPAGVAGAALPFVLWRGAPELVWLLPGFWQILFSLGVFACCRSLPRAMLGVGAWFLGTGPVCVGAGSHWALSPMAMSGAFGTGMLMVAAIHARATRGKAGDGGE